jgi:hypothetical protein
MRESIEDDSGMIAKLSEEVAALRNILVRSLDQINNMYKELDELRTENLTLSHHLRHSAAVAAEIRGILEGKD